MLRSGNNVNVGDKVPLFELPDQKGEVFRAADALGKGPLVVFFYPKDETPVCTLEACSFRDAHADFVAEGATVVGISSDDVASHKRFAARYGLTYPILADVDGVVRRLFGVPRGMFGFSDGRVTYVIDREGVVRHRFASTLQSSAHMREALDTVRTLKRA
jgi:peroxiredoxin Q/BCP